MAIIGLPGGKTRFATGRVTAQPADRVRFELRKLGLHRWVQDAPMSLLTSNDYESRKLAADALRHLTQGAIDYAERISADEGRIARERFRDVIDCLEQLS